MVLSFVSLSGGRIKKPVKFQTCPSKKDMFSYWIAKMKSIFFNKGFFMITIYLQAGVFWMIYLDDGMRRGI